MSKTIIVFDLETTGTSTTKDRIVQMACRKLFPNLQPKEEMKKMLINPQMAIPNEATLVHGITNEDVAGKPTFAQYAKGLFQYLNDCNVAGFNILKFDVPLLSEEFARVGIKWPVGNEHFFDMHKIFALKERRDLKSAYKFFTGKELEGAHDAGVDVDATVEVFYKQLERYTDLGDMTDEQLALFCTDNVRTLDISGNIVLNDKNEPVYAFGKAKGHRVCDDSGFGNWMLKGDFSSNTKSIVAKILNKKIYSVNGDNYRNVFEQL